jgi:hypothetical protein
LTHLLLAFSGGEGVCRRSCKRERTHSLPGQQHSLLLFIPLFGVSTPSKKRATQHTQTAVGIHTYHAQTLSSGKYLASGEKETT